MAGYRPLVLNSGRKKVLQSGDYLSNASWAMPFIYVGQMNYSQYLYAYSHQDASSGGTNTRRSGDASNGYRWTASNPILALFTGKIIACAIAVTGCAVSDNNTSGNKTLRTELFEVGFNGEGTSKGYIDFTVNGTIGAYYDDSVLTAFSGQKTGLNISLTVGKLYALKFISVSTTGYIVSCRNLVVSLEAVKT